MTRKALGKGIDALITRVQESDSAGDSVRKLRLESIVPNRLQPRKDFDEDSIKDLAASIKTHGLAQPILVQDIGDGNFEIIAGERRYRACKYLNLKEIEAIVKKNMEDEKKLAIAMIENLQREDLNPVEEALGYRKLMNQFKMNQSEIAEYCGKSKSAISNTLRILELEEEILDALRNKAIDHGHARALLAIPDRDERKRVFSRIILDALTVRDIENISKRYHPVKDKKNRKSVSKNPEIADMEKQLERILGSKVEIYASLDSRTGKIVLHYYSLEDFDRITGKLRA